MDAVKLFDQLVSIAWMGQALGFAVMVAALGIWRQVANVAGTQMSSSTSWRALLAVLASQAAARAFMGLSATFDPLLARSGWSPGIFLSMGVLFGSFSVVAVAPLWSNVWQRLGGSQLRSALFPWAGAAVAFFCVASFSSSLPGFINASAFVAISLSSAGMFMLTLGQAKKVIFKVRMAAFLCFGVGVVFALAAKIGGGWGEVVAATAAALGSLVILVMLHSRLKELAGGRIESSPAGALAWGLASWGFFLGGGVLLWLACSAPPRPLLDMIFIISLFGAFMALSVHFRRLTLAVSTYIERLGRDRSRALLSGVAAAAVLVDDERRIVECSKVAENFFNAPSSELVGKVVWKVLGVYGGYGSFERVDPQGRHLKLNVSDLGDAYPGWGVATVEDATLAIKASQALDKAAREDELTGLPNRREALSIVDQAIEASRGVDKIGLLFLDLDHFKNVNDTEGHDAGDELLREVASILKECIEEDHGWLARIGGDEFLGVMPGADEDSCMQAANRCISAMERSARAQKGSVGVSVGISIFPRDGDNGLDLIRRADSAMYEAKTEGRGRVMVFGHEIERRLRRRVQVEGFLREALKSGEGLALALQPMCQMDGGYLCEAEALIRAQGMQGLGAQELVDVAEKAGLINQLGRYVLREAVQIQRAHEKAASKLCLSINVSVKQFMDDLFWEQFRGLARLGMFPFGITMEVTESTLMEDKSRAAKLLQEARALGAKIALDDFGAGYSSLSTLQSMPLDKLKLDKSLLDNVPEEPGAARVAQAAIAMGQALGLEIVAEGVERPEQAKWLASKGVVKGQGYLFAKPMRADDLMSLTIGTAEGSKPPKMWSGPQA